MDLLGEGGGMQRTLLANRTALVSGHHSPEAGLPQSSDLNGLVTAISIHSAHTRIKHSGLTGADMQHRYVVVEHLGRFLVNERPGKSIHSIPMLYVRK